MSDYGYICPICAEPILAQDATEQTKDGLAHLVCTDASATQKPRPIIMSGDNPKLILVAAILTLLGLSGCVIGRLDSDNLRVIPITEVHRMDDKGFPLNLFQNDRPARERSPRVKNSRAR